MNVIPSISFSHEDAFWLLLLIPLFALLGWLQVRRRSLKPNVVVMRVLAVTLLILALADPIQTSSHRAASTVFVVDRSESLDNSASSDVTTWINDALSSASSSDRAAIVSFGAGPEVSVSNGSATELVLDGNDLQNTSGEATNIESALTMARALPVEGQRRIVLISDGSENSGEAIAQVAQAATADTPIDVLSVPGIGTEDFRIEAIAAPSTIWTGEVANIILTVATPDPDSGIVTIEVDGQQPVQEALSLSEGSSSHSLALTDLAPGFHSVSVAVSPDRIDDPFPENNSTSFALVVRESPRLLLVSPPRFDATFLHDALVQNGAKVTLVEPLALPERLSDLADIDVVVLDNVPASALTLGQVETLRTATRELGKGLVVVGGTSAFGPGGYAQTPIEGLLPVTVRVTEGKERQSVALMLIIDKSGSMKLDSVQDVNKIAMAREAASIALGALQDGDEFGVLAFNDAQELVVPLTPLEDQEDRDWINARIDMISANGSTEIYPALRVGFDAILESDADVRHVVLLSDGKSDTGTRESYEKLIAEISDSRTTLSTIAFGDGADTDLLQFLAEQGFGQYHATERPEDIPRLLLAEAQGAGSQSVIRGVFPVIQMRPSPIMTGFDPEDLPPVNGYDFSEVKPEGQLVLASSREDPILSKWQFGLGRVVAFTSDDGIDFAQEWRTWDDYGAFWTSVIRWSLPDPESGPVTVDAERDGSDAIVTISSLGVGEDRIDLEEATVQVIGANGSSFEGDLHFQSAPGEYQLRFDDVGPGAYRLDLSYGSGSESEIVRSGFTVPESAELRPESDAASLMESIATRTGGRVLSLDNPDEVFANTLPAEPTATSYRSLWWLPLALGLVVFVVEIGMRTGFLDQIWRQAKSRTI